MAIESAGISISAPVEGEFKEILSDEALNFVAGLHRKFNDTRNQLLKVRTTQQAAYDSGKLPDFLPETKNIREDSWKVADVPADLLDRRTEITGPVDRKMVINALNCGAKVFMGDFEDASSPTWTNMIEGQINLKKRWNGTIDFVDSGSGKEYKLSDQPAVLLVRPRGWHLPERHVSIDGVEVSGSLFDFGLYVFHNAKKILSQGAGVYFYLPKIESHQEARLWNEVFNYAQDELKIPRGTFKATILIETLPAAFEMDEILYEMKEHIVGLNCGRWDYIFSFIKTFRNNNEFILPDRSQVVMGSAFLNAYARLLVHTCHKRGAFAMGGMAAAIPNRKDPEANAVALDKVRADKEREARMGHDGTWVAHPDLVSVATEVFDKFMPESNQLSVIDETINVTQKDLLEIHDGTKTEAGVRENIRVGVQYIEAWLRGRGAVPLYNLMEDAATAEISRAQIWQQLKFGVTLEDGQNVTVALFDKLLVEEMERVKSEIGGASYEAGRFDEAVELFRKLSIAKEFESFLTLPAYKLID